MTDSLLILALWASVPAFAAGAASLRERHRDEIASQSRQALRLAFAARQVATERRFPDCPVCSAQKGASDAQNRPPERLPASR